LCWNETQQWVRFIDLTAHRYASHQVISFHSVFLIFILSRMHQDENVQLVRDPFFLYIRVDNMRGENIGHLELKEAIVMAQIMDDLKSNAAKFGVRKIDGSIPRPAKKDSQPILVEFYSRDRSTEDVVRKLLRSAGIDIFSSRTSFNAVRPQSECEDTKPKAELLVNNLKSGATIEPPKMDTSNLALDWKSEEDLDAIFDKQQESLMNMPLVEPATSPAQTPANLLGDVKSKDSADNKDDDETLQLLLMAELHCVGMKHNSGYVL
jgi:hypothetical protein